ncbi:MAG: hypothetical protein JW932_04560 [Deltaproteobacteria bacterium]|nr:hypothetical protein [Deltaproteobacteria bacterium]
MENQINKTDYYSSNSRSGKVFRIIGMVFVGVIFAVLFALVFGFLVKWLWNFLMPGLFGLAQITYWQAFAMVVLAKLLFGAFGSHPRDKNHGHPSPFDKWHDRFHGSSHAPWDQKGSHWKYYRQYWQDEGKEAFEAYVKRVQAKEEGAQHVE